MDAKTLFFVHDDEAEPFEAQSFAKQGVRADDDVHRAVIQSLARRLCFSGGDEAGETADLDREPTKPLFEIEVMLASQ